jgi:cytochrome c-type biogenesis protein CcmH/NrfG
MSNDYYELLQVHPRADSAAIEAAYRRLQEQYNPARLDGAAAELIEIARRKTAELEAAYEVLSDPQRRAAYDTHQVAGSEESKTAGSVPVQLPDYRPLPPAARTERPRRFDNEPFQSIEYRPAATPRQFGISPGLLVLLALPLIALVAGVLLTGGTAPTSAPVAATTPTTTILERVDAMIANARSDAEANPGDPQRWREYGNLLYDSAQMIRENAPESEIYQQYLPRWLDAADAYSRTLALDPQNAAVQADMGASYCFYGGGAGDAGYVDRGLREVRTAGEIEPDNPRVLLSLGYCLVSTQPPQTEAALAAWQRILETNPAESPFVAQAKALIERYQQ